MRIDWVLLCRYAEAAADGTATIVGGGLVWFWVDEIPVDIQMSLMLRLAAPLDEFDGEHQLEVRLIDPERDEREMASLGFGPLEEPPLVHPGLEAGVRVVSELTWEASHFGLHTVELDVDDRRQRSLPLVLQDPRELGEAA